MIKIKRHKWFPFMCKEVILSVTPDLPLKHTVKIKGKTEKGEKVVCSVETKEESYIQSLCNNWSLEIKNGKITNIDANY